MFHVKQCETKPRNNKTTKPLRNIERYTVQVARTQPRENG